MVIDGKGYEGRAYFGDLIMGACQAVGFEGMVIDGCTRDRDGNIELGFPVYSRGFMPRGPIKKDEGNINTPITCGGVKVDEHFRALDEHGDPVPGLYVLGNAMAGRYGVDYPMLLPGNSTGSGLTYGYLLGRAFGREKAGEDS